MSDRSYDQGDPTRGDPGAAVPESQEEAEARAQDQIQQSEDSLRSEEEQVGENELPQGEVQR